MKTPTFRVVFSVVKQGSLAHSYYWLEVPAKNKSQAVLSAWKQMDSSLGVLFSKVYRVELLEQLGQPNSTHLTETRLAATAFLFRRSRLESRGVPLEPLAKGTNVFKEEKMPIYDFKCPKCEKKTEVMQKFSDAGPTCCGVEAKRVISTTSFALKGRGWAFDGYAIGDGREEK